MATPAESVEGKSDEPTAPAEASTSQPVDQAQPEDKDGVKAEGTGANVRLSRKRTKTGCLTCRRRRIKCGEERPICNNCVKSKRNCEGYNQRVIFKDPVNGYRTAPAEAPPATLLDISRLQQPSASAVTSKVGYNAAASTMYGNQPSLPAIAPRPPQAYSGAGQMLTPPKLEGDASGGYDDEAQRISHQQSTGVFPSSHQVYPGQSRLQTYPAASTSNGKQFNQHQGVAWHAGLYGNAPNRDLTDGRYLPLDLPSASLPSSSSSVHSYDPLSLNGPNPDAQYAQPVSGPSSYHAETSPGQPSNLARFIPSPYEVTPPTSAVENKWNTSDGKGSSEVAQGLSEQEEAHTSHVEAARLRSLHGTSYGASHIPLGQDEDDPFDVESEDDMDLEIAEEGRDTYGANPDFSANMQKDQQQRFAQHFQDAPNQPGLLTTYHPSGSSYSPLRDPKAARLFHHFVTVTGPTLSIYERNAASVSVLDMPRSPLQSERSLWTYALPSLALTCPALLHAMLALSSLQIAKLRRGTMVHSMKYYHQALRRVAKYVSIPSKRGEVGTLAATLLLGFWEVMAAEHMKWNSHLLGARQLLVETDFVTLTRKAKAKRQHQNLAGESRYVGGGNHTTSLNPFLQHRFIRASLALSEQEVDGAVVGYFMGPRLHTHRQTRALDDVYGQHVDEADEFTARDDEDYELRSDLFWWFVKQDLYQSILSGNHLLLSYHHWSHCPPRAALGRVEAPYGTYDHIILLLGRTADFAARDQRRKKKLVEANGGHWRPPPGMMMPHPPPTSEAPPLGQPQQGPGKPQVPAPSATGPTQASQTPMFFGMIPPRGPTQIPRAFADGQASSPASSSEDEIELEAATAEADDEWKEIKRAFQVFEDSLGPAFRPLPSDLVQPLSTPFGPASYYKSTAVACIWAHYYMAHIILHRVHPDMPPAAMMAVGVAARQTSRFANELGRICAGLFPGVPNAPVSPSLGGGLIECSMPLFFAGVQYQDAAQRGWVVSKLQTIARVTGWETSLAIASGCESSWERAGLAGKGPPYSRTMDRMAKDDRIAGRRPSDSKPPKDIADRRFVTVNAGTRVHWAIGILGVEEDLHHLDIDDH